MTAQPTAFREHPLAASVARLHSDLDEAAGLPVWSLDAAGAGEVLVSLTRLAARVAALELTVAGHAAAVAVEDLDGSTSAANWWAQHTRATRAETHRKVRLATAFDAHAVVAEALAAGSILADQAAVVVDAVDALPEDLEPALLTEAEDHLLGLAAGFDATALRRLGQGIVTVVAPEVGEAHEAAVLAREEREAAESARFSMVDDGHGRVHGRFTLPSLQGAMLRKALLAIAAPNHQSAVSGQAPPRRPSPQRLGAAFGGTSSDTRPTGCPGPVGSTRPWWSRSTSTPWATVPARRPWTPVRCSAPVRHGGWRVRPGSSRPSWADPRWCSTWVVPAGSTPRLNASPWACGTAAAPPRAATGHPACVTPTPWHTGGHTNTTTGRHLCPRHHARAHDPAYEITHLPGGRIAFTRRE